MEPANESHVQEIDEIKVGKADAKHELEKIKRELEDSKQQQQQPSALHNAALNRVAQAFSRKTPSPDNSMGAADRTLLRERNNEISHYLDELRLSNDKNAELAQEVDTLLKKLHDASYEIKL